MPFISSLLGRTVADADGEPIGHLQDVIACTHGEMLHPEVVALVIKRHGGTLAIPFSDVAVLVAPAIPLHRRLHDIVAYEPHRNDLFLAQDVLDRQIIDTDGIRVVRVNDLELVQVNGHFYVANVDVGGLGLLRRMGVAKPAQRIAHLFRRELRSNVISWDDVELLPGGQPMRLRVPGDKISELHPADLAEIISDLSRVEGSRLLETLDVKTLADTLEEVEPDFQASLVQHMPDERVADVLEEMAPDEAADLLAELPEDRSQDLLELMEDEEAEDVRKLLTYAVDTAGGIMTTDYAAIHPDLTAEQAISLLRETSEDPEAIFYVYVTDQEDHLVGVFSLGELILARPDAAVAEFMEGRVVSVNLRESQDEVAQAVAKYNLRAVPVVDDEGKMHGIVTADDALDKIIPTAWKKRLPRLYH